MENMKIKEKEKDIVSSMEILNMLEKCMKEIENGDTTLEFQSFTQNVRIKNNIVMKNKSKSKS